jgi:long-chain acyl-CoA synthetase
MAATGTESSPSPATDSTDGTAPAASTTTLVDHFRRQVRDRAASVAMYFRAGERWAPISWSQFGVAADRIAGLLLDDGVAPGDHVAIWSANRPEWHIADAGILTIRARPVPVYLTLSAEQAAYVLGHSESRVVVVETRAILDKVLAIRDQLPALRRIVVMTGVDEVLEDGLVLPWALALERGQEAARRHASAILRLVAQGEPDDVATLIYTSGTTGAPKAVMLTHRNVMAASAGVEAVVSGNADDRIVSYLPLAHIAERMNSEFRSYVNGNVTYFAASIDALADDLRDVRPTLFFAVPRV